MEEVRRELALGRLAGVILAEMKGEREVSTFPISLHNKRWEQLKLRQVITNSLRLYHKEATNAEYGCKAMSYDKLENVPSNKLTTASNREIR